MKRKQKFETPAVLLELDLGLEGRMMFQNSVVETMTVKTVGQEVKDWDFSAGGEDNPFNHEWE